LAEEGNGERETDREEGRPKEEERRGEESVLVCCA